MPNNGFAWENAPSVCRVLGCARYIIFQRALRTEPFFMQSVRDREELQVTACPLTTFLYTNIDRHTESARLPLINTETRVIETTEF